MNVNQYSLYLVLAPIGAGLTFLLAYFLLRSMRFAAGARELAAYLIAVTGAVILNALELADPSPFGTKLWAQLNYIFLTAIPATWFTFVLYYTGRTQWLQRRRYWILWVVPLLITGLALTNDWHGLIWSQTAFVPVAGYLALRVSHGPAFWLFAVYGYGLYLLGAVWMVWQYVWLQPFYRRQSGWVLLGSLLPLTSNLIYIFHLIPGLQKDYSPLGFALSGIFFAVGLFKHRLFDLMPVARATLIERMEDGVLVADAHGRIVDINQSAQRILGHQYPTTIGAGVSELLARAGEPGRVEPQATLQIDRERIYQLQRTRLSDDWGRYSGDLLALRDITSQIQLQQTLQQRQTELEERVAARTAELQALNATLEDRVQSRTRFLSALYQVSALVNQSTAMEPMLQAALSSVIDAVEADAGCIHMIAEGGGCLLLTAQQNLSSAELDSARSADAWEELAAQNSFWGNRPDDSQQIPVFAFTLVAPIQVQHNRLGVLTLICRNRPQWEAEDVSVIEAVAGQIGIGMINLRLQEQARQAAVQQERARLARDLHDSVMQLLYSQSLFADAAHKALTNGRPDQGQQFVRRVQEIADQAVREMRLLIYQLRPAALQEGGLVGALRSRLEMVEQRAGLAVHLELSEDLCLPAEIENGLYRIAEEALNNVLKHAQAPSVRVSLSIQPDTIHLAITDDGQGFDPATARPGLGLQSLRERTEQLGGRLTIMSQPHQGTEITVQIPRLPFTPVE